MMGKYYFGGYTLTFSALEKMTIARTGQTVPVVHGIGPYVAQMREALNTPTNTLGESFDALFPVVRVVPMIEGSLNTEGVVLVRADGNDSHPGCLVETAGDKHVKKVVESCLGLKLGPFQAYEYVNYLPHAATRM
jgi:hypothetical protein